MILIQCYYLVSFDSGDIIITFMSDYIFSAETFFDEVRSKCWEKCVPPEAEINCEKYKPNCYNTTEVECRGTVWLKDKENCHFYRTCLRDKYTSQKWVVCR